MCNNITPCLQWLTKLALCDMPSYSIHSPECNFTWFSQSIQSSAVQEAVKVTMTAASILFGSPCLTHI